jgi:uncharacterized membrane protein YkgB
MEKWSTQFDRLDACITDLMARYAVVLMRIGLGIVFFWFGMLKFFPGLSPAQDLAIRTIDLLTFRLIPANLSLVLLAVWECVIGLGLISSKFLRGTILLLLIQMLGTVTPLVLFPSEAFVAVPIAPTLEGQYIIKNIVLVSAALVIGATVRGGRVVADPAQLKEQMGWRRSTEKLSNLLR